MFGAIAKVLAWFYGLVPNYVAAIAMLTLTVMVLLLPLTLRGTKNMLKMQKLQPELKRLQQEHKGDRQKMNEELMGLYQREGINPLGGCLPMLLQIPVFIVLYRVIVKLTETCTQGKFSAGECLTVGNFAPAYIDHTSELWKDLANSSEMLSFGLDLASSAADKIKDGFVDGLPYLTLVLLVTATSYIQQRQISARSKGQVVNPQQAMLMKILPAFFALISVTLPAAIVVYFLISNTFRIGQQAYITRAFYAGTDGGTSGGSGNGAEPPKPKPAPKPVAAAKPRPTPGRVTPKAQKTPPGRVTPPKTPPKKK